jgi:hypothetical protein
LELLPPSFVVILTLQMISGVNVIKLFLFVTGAAAM